MVTLTGRIGTFQIGIDALGAATPIMFPLGYSRVGDLSSAIGLSPPVEAVAALLVAEGAALRLRDDGVDPTETSGLLLPREVPLLYQGDLAAARFVQVAPGASLGVLYYSLSPPPAP